MLVLLDYGALSILNFYEPQFWFEWHPEEVPVPDAFTRIWFWSSVPLVMWFAPRGILTGALCGFYAPASRSFNPFRSRFVRRVAREVVLLGIFSFLGAALTVWASMRGLEAVNFHGDAFLVGLCAFLLLDACGFGLVLWRALNHALAAEKAALADEERL